jgi:zinc protease
MKGFAFLRRFNHNREVRFMRNTFWNPLYFVIGSVIGSLICSASSPSWAGPQAAKAADAVVAVGTAGVSTAGSDISKQIRFGVEKFKLANGLTVLLQEDHSAPVIAYHTWFRVGSKYEEPGFTGIAHLFEHMMFKGAKRYSGEQFDTILQLNGAINNAFTTYDYTGYHENFPSSKLELIMDIESDRMVNLQVTPENLKSEREVVKEERRWRVDDNPTGTLRELLYSTAFKVHPYRWPVIGYMKDIDAITLEKAREFHKMYYAPNNAVIVIAGDFNTPQAKSLIEKYYGPLEAQTITPKPRPTEPVQRGIRNASIDREVQTAQFAIAYHTPKAGEDESYALDLLANILGYGQSSRLHQRLVYKDQIASSITVYNYTLQDSGLFQMYVTMKPGVDPGKAQRALYGEMWRPAHMVIKPDELQKAKNQVMKSYVDGLKTVQGRAEALAVNEVLFADYERLFTDLDRYNKVTAEQIKKAAEKYLAPEKSTIVFLRPQKSKKGSAPKAAKGQGGQ